MRNWPLLVAIHDGARIAQLFDYITRGLAFRHFGLLFPESEYFVHSEFYLDRGRAMFDRFFEGNARRTGQVNLGNGVFRYDGIQSLESPHITMWRMTLGVVVMGNDNEAPGETVQLAYGLSAPRRLAATTGLVQHLRLMRPDRAPPCQYEVRHLPGAI